MSLPSPLVLITDRRAAKLPLLDVLALALDAGCRWLLLREKDLPDVELIPLLRDVLALAAPYGATVSVSASVAAATACTAGGLHLPGWVSPIAVREIVGEKMLIGASTHSLREAQQAGAAGADYVFLSPIFLTASKPGYGPALGLDALSRAASALPIPVLALGGILPENARACLRAGAAGVAVMGSVMRAEAPDEVIRNLLKILLSTDYTDFRRLSKTKSV